MEEGDERRSREAERDSERDSHRDSERDSQRGAEKESVWKRVVKGAAEKLRGTRSETRSGVRRKKACGRAWRGALKN